MGFFYLVVDYSVFLNGRLEFSLKGGFFKADVVIMQLAVVKPSRSFVGNQDAPRHVVRLNFLQMRKDNLRLVTCIIPTQHTDQTF